LATDKLFDEFPETIPITLVLRGQSGFGKTYLANILNGKERTYFADTHPTNSTIETLKIIKNPNFKKTPTWGDLVQFTNSIIQLRQPPGTIVLDTASFMNNMGMAHYKKEHGKQVFEFAWGEVWGYFRNWMSSVTDHGFDLVLTIQMAQRRDAEGSIIEGEFRAHEWKSLIYESSATIELCDGLEINGKRYFEGNRFIKIIKTRFQDIGHMKPYIVGEPTKENVLSQLKERWEGDESQLLEEFKMDILSKEDKATLKEQKLLRDLESVIKENVKEISESPKQE
jgi:hypothetical protein